MVDLTLTGEINGEPKVRVFDTAGGHRWAIYGPYASNPSRKATIDYSTPKDALNAGDRILISMYPAPADKEKDA